MLKVIGVIGPSEPSSEAYSFAERFGELAAKEGWVLATGGKGGIMEAASKGAKKAGGLTIGILPEKGKENANPYVDIVISTGIGESRNLVLVYSADIVVAITLSLGTLIEIATAAKNSKPLLGYNIPEIPGVKIEGIKTPEEGIEKIKTFIK